MIIARYDFLVFISIQVTWHNLKMNKTEFHERTVHMFIQKLFHLFCTAQWMNSTTVLCVLCLFYRLYTLIMCMWQNNYADFDAHCACTSTETSVESHGFSMDILWPLQNARFKQNFLYYCLWLDCIQKVIRREVHSQWPLENAWGALMPRIKNVLLHKQVQAIGTVYKLNVLYIE